MKKIKDILEKVRPDVDFNTTKKLIDDGVLDSFDIVALVVELNDCFDTEIGVEHLTPENFNSMESIKKLIDSFE